MRLATLLPVFALASLSLVACQQPVDTEEEGTSNDAIATTPSEAKNGPGAAAVAAETAEMERYRDLYRSADEAQFVRTPYYKIYHSKFYPMSGQGQAATQPAWYEWRVPGSSAPLYVVELDCLYPDDVFGIAEGESAVGRRLERAVLIYDEGIVLRGVLRVAKKRWFIPSAVPLAPQKK